MCVCDPVTQHGVHYNEDIASFFHQCVYGDLELASFVSGLASIAVWCVAMAPQFYENYRRHRAEALSPWFLLQWLLGDVSNLLGCLYTHQLPTQTYTAYVFVGLDVLILSQWSYYRWVYPWRTARARAGASDEHGDASAKLSPATSLLAGLPLLALLWLQHDAVRGQAAGPARVLLSSGGEDLCETSVDELSSTAKVVGSVFAWTSGSLYFFSRFPQIYHNWRRKSVMGLALPMFLLAILANVTYGLSILLNLPTVDAWWFQASFPYVLGSVGTLLLDVFILFQSTCLYPRFREPVAPSDTAQYSNLA